MAVCSNSTAATLPASLKIKSSHIDYTSFAESNILNPDLRDFLSKLDQLTMGTKQQPDLLSITPTVQNEAEFESQIGLEIVKQSSFIKQFEDNIQQTNVENQDVKDLIVSTLKEIFPKENENLNLILSLFPQDGVLPVKEALTRVSKDQLAQAVAFPDSTLLDQFLQNYDDENNRIDLDVKFLAALATSCENLQTDDYLNRYKEDLLDYKKSKPHESFNSLSSASKAQLEKIRGNVLRNIEFFLKNSPKRKESLLNYSNRKLLRMSKRFEKKEVASLKKIFNSNSIDQELLSASVISNCFLCPAAANDVKPVEKVKYKFVNKAVSNINIQRVMPLWNFEEIRKHWQNHHGKHILHLFYPLELSILLHLSKW